MRKAIASPTVVDAGAFHTPLASICRRRDKYQTVHRSFIFATQISGIRRLESSMPASSKRAAKAANRDPLVLPARLDAGAAQDLLDTLRVAGEGSPVTLDGAAVEFVSTTCIQILLAAARLSDDDGDFRLASPSPALAAAFADLGLQQHLDGWMTRDG
jgi:chemotaxis protein CheX